MPDEQKGFEKKKYGALTASYVLNAGGILGALKATEASADPYIPIAWFATAVVCLGVAGYLRYFYDRH